MIPVLLDVLTIFFIVAGLALLWLNLCVWRRRTVPKVLPEPSEHVAEMSNIDLATSRARAKECLELAAQSTSQRGRAQVYEYGGARCSSGPPPPSQAACRGRGRPGPSIPA